ncbi:MAG: DUF5522 domain-containing protein [Chitinophagales bacterium]
MSQEKQAKLVEGIDYIINETGLLVFTKHYLLKRGYCCGNGCQNCPYTKK